MRFSVKNISNILLAAVFVLTVQCFKKTNYDTVFDPFVPFSMVNLFGLMPPSPPVPTTTPDIGKITISFSSLNSVTSHNIYWNTTGSPSKSSNKIENVTSPYIHAPLTNKTKYYYVVSSVNGKGEGAVSSVVSDTPSSGGFASTGSMSVKRQSHTATLLQNGKVLITGGYSYNNGTYYSYATAELYDPTTGTFSTTGSMSVKRQSHTATLLKNGKVLITGGYYYNSGSNSLASAELYDPE